MSLVIAVPKEIKNQERRVGLVPKTVRELTLKGLQVIVQENAGKASGFYNADYEKAGAGVVSDADEVYQNGNIIVKVKEPLPPEFPLLNSQHILFCFLHLASQEHCSLIDVIVQSKATAIGFETLNENGFLPLLAPMSQIAGGLSAAYSAALFSVLTEKGWQTPLAELEIPKYLEETAVKFPNLEHFQKIPLLAIFGAGVAGRAAFDVAQKTSSKVIIIEKDPRRRSEYTSKGIAAYSPEDSLETILEDADVLIGSAHAVGQRAAKVISPEILKTISLRKKKILMDISIDQGGNFPDSRSTRYDDPVYLDTSGNLRFCVPNIPSLAGRLASELLSEAALPYVQALATNAKQAFTDFPALRNAVNIEKGVILNEAVRNVHQKS